MSLNNRHKKLSIDYVLKWKTCPNNPAYIAVLLNLLHLCLHLSLNCGSHWGSADDCTTISPPFFCVLHCPLGLQACPFPDIVFLPPLFLSASSSSLFNVPCKMVLAGPDERETCLYHFILCLFTMVRRLSSWDLIACWILVGNVVFVWDVWYLMVAPHFHGSYSALLWGSMSHNHTGHRKMNVTRECVSCIMKLTEVLLLF